MELSMLKGEKVSKGQDALMRDAYSDERLGIDANVLPELIADGGQRTAVLEVD